MEPIEIQGILTDIPARHHINPCNQILTKMKYGVNRVTLVGNVGEVPRVSETEGEAFVANFPLATNEVWKDKEGEEDRKTEWHQIEYIFGTQIRSSGLHGYAYHM